MTAAIRNGPGDRRAGAPLCAASCALPACDPVSFLAPGLLGLRVNVPVLSLVRDRAPATSIRYANALQGSIRREGYGLLAPYASQVTVTPYRTPCILRIVILKPLASTSVGSTENPNLSVSRLAPELDAGDRHGNRWLGAEGPCKRYWRRRPDRRATGWQVLQRPIGRIRLIQPERLDPGLKNRKVVRRGGCGPDQYRHAGHQNPCRMMVSTSASPGTDANVRIELLIAEPAREPLPAAHRAPPSLGSFDYWLAQIVE